jgi:enamine deaminase RidA (YjgF/YER057c/UK114 family)
MSDRTRVHTGSPYEKAYGFCRALRVGDRVLVAGTAPIEADGSCAPDAAGQTRRCLEIIGAGLAKLGASPDDVVRTRIFLTDAADADAVGKVHGEVYATAQPVTAMVVVAALLNPLWKVEIEAEAVIGG